MTTNRARQRSKASARCAGGRGGDPPQQRGATTPHLGYARTRCAERARARIQRDAWRNAAGRVLGGEDSAALTTLRCSRGLLKQLRHTTAGRAADVSEPQIAAGVHCRNTIDGTDPAVRAAQPMDRNRLAHAGTAAPRPRFVIATATARPHAPRRRTKLPCSACGLLPS